MTDRIAIVGAARTPIGKFGGSLAALTAPQLGALAIQAAIERSGLRPADADYTVMGNVLTAGLGQAPARQAALQAGVPPSAEALVVNQVCASGLTAVVVGAQLIQAGLASVVVAGGMESMSQSPYLLPRHWPGGGVGEAQPVDSLTHDGLLCAIEHQHMGNAAEAIARSHSVSREVQDRFALESHLRAAAAQADGRFAAEIVAVRLPGGGELTTDQGPRANSTTEGLARLKPVFDPAGTVTAGNASQLSDGAAAVVLMSEAGARERGLPVLARLLGSSAAGVDPARVFEAPVAAYHNLQQATGLADRDIDLLELNEAFAAQVVANVGELRLDANRLNVNGGAIALGHPLGASGARILVTLLHAMQQRDVQTGVALICHGGGGAVGLAVERG